MKEKEIQPNSPRINGTKNGEDLNAKKLSKINNQQQMLGTDLNSSKGSDDVGRKRGATLINQRKKNLAYFTMSLKIGSLNINGIRSNAKQTKL